MNQNNIIFSVLLNSHKTNYELLFFSSVVPVHVVHAELFCAEKQ